MRNKTAYPNNPGFQKKYLYDLFCSPEKGMSKYEEAQYYTQQ